MGLGALRSEKPSRLSRVLPLRVSLVKFAFVYVFISRAEPFEGAGQ